MADIKKPCSGDMHAVVEAQASVRTDEPTPDQIRRALAEAEKHGFNVADGVVIGAYPDLVSLMVAFAQKGADLAHQRGEPETTYWTSTGPDGERSAYGVTSNVDGESARIFSATLELVRAIERGVPITPETLYDHLLGKRALAEVPIPMILHCPACGTQHIDEAEGEGDDEATTRRLDIWTNPPHRSHKCSYCGYIWRPADVATTGVEKISTQGKNDRGFSVGDTLTLQEYDAVRQRFTGCELHRRVTYVLDFPVGLRDGYVGLGLAPTFGHKVPS